MRPAVPAGQGVGLRGLPPDKLFEPAKLRLQLAGDRQTFTRLMEHRVDPASARPVDRHLRERPPAWMAGPEHQFQHRRLVPVADCRPGVGVEPRAQIGAQRRGEPLVRLDRRPCSAGLDPVEEPAIDARFRGEPGPTHARVLAEAHEVLGKEVVASAGRASDGGLELGCGHGRIEPMTAYAPLAGVAGDWQSLRTTARTGFGDSQAARITGRGRFPARPGTISPRESAGVPNSATGSPRRGRPASSGECEGGDRRGRPASGEGEPATGVPARARAAGEGEDQPRAGNGSSRRPAAPVATAPPAAATFAAPDRNVAVRWLRPSRVCGYTPHTRHGTG